jgi:hypothetical protein
MASIAFSIVFAPPDSSISFRAAIGETIVARISHNPKQRPSSSWFSAARTVTITAGTAARRPAPAVSPTQSLTAPAAKRRHTAYQATCATEPSLQSTDLLTTSHLSSLTYEELKTPNRGLRVELRDTEELGSASGLVKGRIIKPPPKLSSPKMDPITPLKRAGIIASVLFPYLPGVAETVVVRNVFSACATVPAKRIQSVDLPYDASVTLNPCELSHCSTASNSALDSPKRRCVSSGVSQWC